jgi:hypothetical protein
MGFKHDEVIMKLFIDNTKTYIQLSTGALLLSITFLEKVLGGLATMTSDIFLIGSWAAFLIAIGSGAYYQYLAVKYLESISGNPGSESILPKKLRDPGTIFGIMMVAFYAGAVLFTFMAIMRIISRSCA